MKKATPIITVDAIEPCLDFWTTLGLTVTVTVPHEDAMGFAMLHQGDIELGESGAPAGLGAELAHGTSTLFVEVDDLDATIAALGEREVVVARRQTFYGMDEIFVRAPCGTLVGLAAKIEGSE
jgi:hypothetical protein